MCEPAEVLCCFFRALADDRDIEAAADCARDVFEWHALIRYGVISGSSGTLLKHEAVEMSGSEPNTAAQRLSPAPTYADTPFSRAKPMSIGTKP